MNRVPSIHDKFQDRSLLNVGGRVSSKKKIMAVALFGLGVTGLIAGLLLSLARFSDSETVIVAHDSDQDYLAGAIDDTTVDIHALAEQNDADQLRKADEAAASQVNTPPIVTLSPPVVSTPTEKVNVSRSQGAPEPPRPTKQELALARKLSGLPAVLSKTAAMPTPTAMGNFDTSFDAPQYADGIATVKKRGALDFMLMHGAGLC